MYAIMLIMPWLTFLDCTVSLKGSLSKKNDFASIPKLKIKGNLKKDYKIIKNLFLGMSYSQNKYYI